MEHEIKAIIGLGNPGAAYEYQRHNIGFRILDALAQAHGASWISKGEALCAAVMINGSSVILIKPQTFMNSSGRVYSMLSRQGVKAENILVVHDELEKKPGALSFKTGGSHRGHNGLRSLIDHCGANFMRLRVGIGRPESKDDVPRYVLSPFEIDVEPVIVQAVQMIQKLFG